MIAVSVDTSKFDRLLHDFPAALARAQRNALQNIGARVKEETSRAFREPNLRPSPWASRKPSKHDDGHPLLIKSGALRQSFGWRLEGSGVVVVGTDRKYASYHQQGTKNMPARPFFPIDKSGQLTTRIMRKINADVEAAFASELRKIGG